MTRRKRPRLTTPAPPMMTVTEANDLAADLIAEPTEHAGDRRAVGACLMRWAEREDFRGISLVCMAAVQQVFADCLTRVPLDTMPPGALTLTRISTDPHFHTEGITHA